MLSTKTYGSIENPALIFLHGLFGRKEDWEPLVKELQNSYFCLCIDLPGHGDSKEQADPLQALSSTIDSYSLFHPIAIGYSLGGRVLMHLQKERKTFFSSLFFLSAHPGLHDAAEKKMRSAKENIWIKKLQTEPLDAVLLDWYNQPLFDSLARNHPLFTEIFQQRTTQNIDGLLALYKKFRLSEQEYFSHFSAESFFFYGEYDTTYEKLYKAHFPNGNIEKIPQSGHAIHIENPLCCAQRIATCLQLRQIV